MFCQKCGTQLPDDAMFCNNCGNKVGESTQGTYANEAAVNKPTNPVTEPTAPDSKINVTSSSGAFPFVLPKISGLIALGFALLAFIFMFCPWAAAVFSLLGYTYRESFSLFHGSMFELSALLGLAKVFGIINIIVFVAYLVASFIDLKKLVPFFSFDYKKYTQIAFYGLYALQLLFSLIGIITTEYVGIGACWFIALVFAGAGVVCTFKPEVLENILPKK